MNLGNTISQLRGKKGLKQSEMAELLHITSTYLSQIENNKKLPTMALLERISNQLSTPLPFIFMLSMDDKDIPPSKAAHFKLLQPALRQFMLELIDTP
ncbi:helix-turn-helix domain-containing protein [Chitinophaga rhizosphaerae]|uniref:helix-turn-helix domain-containing protein n=1 Tax=Chitinophaga rhizosphaerae TaxID=1864947 RepID=UPI000F81355B|nr:helix-turn-helix transcriptional regulator [Chitinophaga rhizosphaerae]